MAWTVATLVALLALANGANDVPKGVATLAGPGVATYRSATMLGTAATAAGSVASILVAGRLSSLFASGIVATRTTPVFGIAVLAGAAGWVAIASVTRLPVSTTHALIGALVGAGLAVHADAVRWSAVALRVGVPLGLSVVVAFAASTLLNLRPSDDAGRYRSHWVSAGGASFVRGLNDGPKIAGVGAAALASTGHATRAVGILVTVAMVVGALAGGRRLAHRLGHGIVRMSAREAGRAGGVVAVLVGMGALAGWPMSTTHVAVGAIAGTSGGRSSRLNGTVLRDFAAAWLVTPLVAGLVAAAVVGVLS